MVRIENDRITCDHFQAKILDILPVYLTGGISLSNPIYDTLKNLITDIIEKIEDQKED